MAELKAFIEQAPDGFDDSDILAMFGPEHAAKANAEGDAGEGVEEEDDEDIEIEDDDEDIEIEDDDEDFDDEYEDDEEEIEENVEVEVKTEEDDGGDISVDYTESSNGFLPWAFSVPPEQLVVDRGRKLLQRFLKERAIHELFAFASLAGRVPKNPTVLLEECARRLQQYENLGQPPARSLSDEWANHKRQQEQFRGRELIGLKTGMDELDKRTLGVRDIMVLGAMPGAGKTTLAVQIGVGVARRHADNDAVVVIISLDMSRDEIMDRIHCHLAGIDWTTLKFGSWDRRRVGESPWFNQQDQVRLDAADRQIVDEGLGSRILVHDRMSLGNIITASRLSNIVEAFKRQAGASRSFLIIDYLQLLPVPEAAFKGGDLEGDKCRIRLIQDYLDRTRTPANPAGDPVLAISEARKPPKAKDGWGYEMAELMGSARLAYAPPMVFMYRPASDTDLVTYHNATKQEVDSLRAVFESHGIAPVVLTLAKGRDGTQRGSWGLEFDYRRSTFHAVATRSQDPVIPTAEDDEDDATDTASNPPAPTPAPALPPAGRRQRAKSAAHPAETTPRTDRVSNESRNMDCGAR